jgi:ribosomal protein S18 acetylase RimI-like enzyme
MEIEYTINKSSFHDIFVHLNKCNSIFKPCLDTRVNIESYAQKIKNNAVTFEAWHESELAGLIAAYFTDADKEIAYITNVSILEQIGGKGIGTSLLLECIKYASMHQFRRMTLRVSKESQAAIRLYKKFEFYEIADEESEILMSKKISFHNPI